MTLPGSPDYQGQVAQTVRFVNSYHFDAFPTTTVDFSADVLPNDEALLVFYVADVAFAGDVIVATVVGTSPALAFGGATQVPDGGSFTVPFAGALIVGGPSATATFSLQTGAGSIPEVKGTLYVFAYQAPAVVLPLIKRSLIGKGQTTGRVTISGASTQTLLVGPQTGTYYRIKLLGFTVVGAPTSANRVEIQTLTSPQTIVAWAISTAANQEHITTLDLELDDGIQVVNAVTSAVTITCAYEIWQS